MLRHVAREAALALQVNRQLFTVEALFFVCLQIINYHYSLLEVLGELLFFGGLLPQADARIHLLPPPQEFHSLGFVHQDVNPGNFCLSFAESKAKGKGRGRDNRNDDGDSPTLTLIDYGLATRTYAH